VTSFPARSGNSAHFSAFENAVSINSHRSASDFEREKLARSRSCFLKTGETGDKPHFLTVNDCIDMGLAYHQFFNSTGELSPVSPVSRQALPFPAFAWPGLPVGRTWEN
jgi:hypothetical protein